MKDFFWKLFEKSGSIDAFLAYKEYTDFDNTLSPVTLSDKRE